MKYILPYLLSVSFLSIIACPSFGQQDNDALAQEVQTQKQQILELQSKLQVLDNVEKMELAAKLAEANTKLRNADLDKLKLELKDSNQQWLRNQILYILAFLSVFGLTFWGWFKSKVAQLITDAVEKEINDFRSAIEQVKTQQEKTRILEKELAATVIDDILYYNPGVTYPYPERIEAISDTALLDVFDDEKRQIDCRCKAAEFLADRESEQIVSPLIVFLNSIFDYDPYTHKESNSQVQIKLSLQKLIKYLGTIHTKESYKELTKLLDRLLKEHTPMKDMLLTWTVFSLADVGGALNTGSSIPKMIKAVPDLRLINAEMSAAIKNLALYFDKFDEPDGIKDILTYFGDQDPKVKETCLDLLENHDPNFVAQQRVLETTVHTTNGNPS